LSRVRETYLYETAIPETRTAYDQWIEAALAGDLTELEQYVAANGVGSAED